MDKSDSDGFFFKRLGCRTNDRSYNSTDSSLITVDSECFLAFLCSTIASKINATADQARDDHATYYVIPCHCTWMSSINSIIYLFIGFGKNRVRHKRLVHGIAHTGMYIDLFSFQHNDITSKHYYRLNQ